MHKKNEKNARNKSINREKCRKSIKSRKTNEMTHVLAGCFFWTVQAALPGSDLPSGGDAS